MKKRCPDFAAILRDTPPDEAIREQIAACFYEELRRVAHRLCRNETLAEDAVQDALETGLRSLDRFRGDASVLTWLRRLVTSACNRLRRGRKNDPHVNRPLEEAGDAAAEEQESQEVQLLIHERLEILGETLAQMDEVNRELLLLHEGQEVSVGALADRFGLTPEAVKSRLKRTRAALRTQLLRAAEEWID